MARACLAACAAMIALWSFPIHAEVVHVPASEISAWLQLEAVASGEPIEVTVVNGTVLKGIFRNHSSEGMDLHIESSRGKNPFPSGDVTVDYANISKFRLRVGHNSRTRAVLGGVVGFFIGASPGAVIGLNDYGSKTTEKVGPVIMLVGGVSGAWLGAKWGARKKITIQVTH